MSSEDQFTSVQWDRDSDGKQTPHNEPIAEVDEDDPSTSLVLSQQHHSEAQDQASEPQQPAQAEQPPQAHADADSSGAQSEAPDQYVTETTVSDPIRDVDQASKPYISYLVTTTTDNPGIIKLATKKDSPSTISVRRRYGDFRNLYHCLTNDYPQLLIPPLPSKANLKYLTGDTFAPEFVHKRLNSFNRFVKYLNGHKILSQAPVYFLFLSDSGDWVTFSKNLKINNISEVEKEQSFASNVVSKVVNEELLTETIMNFLTPSKNKKETNKDILEISDKLKKLYENLTKLDKIFVRLNKKNNDLANDYEAFSVQIDKLSISKEGDGEDNFKFFTKCLRQYSESWATSFKFLDEAFLTSLKDCSKYIINLTNLIELQHNKKIDLQVLQDYLEQAQQEHASLPSGSGAARQAPPSPIRSGNNGIVNNTTQLIKDTLATSASSTIGSSSTESKKIKLENKIAQLEKEIATQTKIVQDLVNNIIYEEYPNWDKFNKNEMKNSMVQLCDSQIEFYKSLVQNWNETEAKLMKRIDGFS